jgi:hypothetical protein
MVYKNAGAFFVMRQNSNARFAIQSTDRAEAGQFGLTNSETASYTFF